MNILLVEDDVFFQKFYSTKLREHDFHVDIATNGVEGITAMKKKQYALVLLDLVMPKMDGFEVLRIVSQDATLQVTPIIVFSTLGQEADIQNALKLGAKDYMNKTFFNFEELLDKIKKVTM
jgi:DNA-binding response OmpR family regulator